MNTPAERLKWTLQQFGYHRKQGIVAKRIGISAARFTRILKGSPMYDFEIVALVEYFPGLSYRWLLEGYYDTEYRRQSDDALNEHIKSMTDIERQNLLEMLRNQ